MTSPIRLNVPPGASVFNRLYDTQNTELLDEDLLTVRLANGFCIDVAWLPQNDPTGHYVVRVFREFGDADAIDPIQSSDVGEVAALVERLCRRYDEHRVSMSQTSSAKKATAAA
jgi:hypothetical protein